MGRLALSIVVVAIAAVTTMALPIQQAGAGEFIGNYIR